MFEIKPEMNNLNMHRFCLVIRPPLPLLHCPLKNRHSLTEHPKPKQVTPRREACTPTNRGAWPIPANTSMTCRHAGARLTRPPVSPMG